MNLTVKFRSEPAAITLDVDRLAIVGNRVVIHYTLGKMPTKHSELVENLERLYLDAHGHAATMKLVKSKPASFAAIKILTITRETLVLEESSSNVAMQHREAVAQVEELEIA
ncbi:MAG: hypothetical protein Q6370_020515 [Candidatus Sigynarchaeota archaeon]